MPRLVAIVLPAGAAFARALAEAWADGDAVVPIDPRLPSAAARRLLEAMRPAVLVDGSGEGRPLPDPVDTEPGDALVVATSGTTGEPRGAVLTHDAVRASADAVGARLAVDPDQDAWLAILPVAHIGGLSVVTRALVTGTPLLFDDHDDRATLVSVVPTQANRLDLDRFRVVLVGAGADDRERPANVIHTYGMTETGSGVAYDGVPLDGVEFRVGPHDGEIHVRGPMLLRAYRDGADPRDPNGWFPTGDAGHLDAEGRIHVAGRLAEVVVTGGEKVWPTPVEEAIRSHPGVADVAVAGRPDPDWGQRVVAWVVPRDPSTPPTLESLRDHVKATLPAYAAPREVVITAALPRTDLGKIRRKFLTDGR